jgi:hypothetical protein
MRLVWSLLACGAVLSSWRDAWAAPLLVEWVAPACAQEQAFRARVRDALRREPESALERELRISLTIGENAEKTGYLLQVRTDAGARQLELPTCDEAVAAAATVVALTIDPNAAAAAEPESAPAPAAEPRPVRPPVVRVAEPAPAPSKRGAPAARLESYVAAFAGVSLGDVPALSPLVGGGAGLRFGRWGFGAEGFWIAPQTELLPGTNKGGEIGLWGGGVSACYLVPAGDLKLSGCLAGQAGVWRSSGVGVTDPVEQSDWWAASVARLGGSARLGPPLGLFLTADAVVPARRPSFKLEALGQVFRPNLVAGRFSGGVELSF